MLASHHDYAMYERSKKVEQNACTSYITRIDSMRVALFYDYFYASEYQ